MITTDCYTGLSWCRYFHELWLPKDVEVAGVAIGIRIIGVCLMPGKPWEQCVGCEVELNNRAAGISVRDMYPLTFSFVDDAFHFPVAMNSRNIFELAESLGLDFGRDREKAVLFLLKMQRSCERALFFFHDNWMERWFKKDKVLPTAMVRRMPNVVASRSHLKLDDAGNILSTHLDWPELDSDIGPVELRHNRSILMEKDTILVRVPYEERDRARALGLKWSARQHSWEVPTDMPIEGVKKVLTMFSSQTPEEAEAFAREQRESAAYRNDHPQPDKPQAAEASAGDERKNAAGKDGEPEQAEKAQKSEEISAEEAQKNRAYLETAIPPYARMYLKPRMFSAEERQDLKSRRAVYDPDNRRWCIDRRLPMFGLEGKLLDYIIVPMAEKDHVKALGARWDHVQRSWYVPEGVTAPELNVYTRLRETPVRNYISVPPTEEKTVRDLGALFDPVAKVFFIPREANPKDFERWKPDNLSPAVASHPKLSEGDRERMNAWREKRERQNAQQEAQQQAQSHGRRLTRQR